MTETGVKSQDLLQEMEHRECGKLKLSIRRVFPKLCFPLLFFFYNAQAVIQTMENLEHRITQADYAQFTNNETGDTKSLIDKPTGTKSRTLIFSFLFIFFIFSSLILFVIFIKSEKHAGMAEL